LETAQAIKKTDVLQLSRSDFLTIVSNYPFVAFQIMKALTSRLRQSYLGLIEDLGEKDEELKKAHLESSESAQPEKIQQPQDQVSFSDEIISGFPFSIIGTNEDGTISIFNQAAEEEYGFSSEEIAGKGINLLRGEGNLSNLDELISRALKDKGVWNGEIIARRKNGEQFLSETTVYTVDNSKRGKTAILWISKDVTLEKGLARETSDKKKQLNAQERIGEVILQFNDEIQRISEDLNALIQEVNESNLPQSKALIKTMKNILDSLKGITFASAVLPSPEGAKKPMDLANLIQTEMLLLRRQKRFEGIDFITQYDDKLPLVDVDERHIRQLLTELLDNAAFALSSTPNQEKTITIETRYLASDREVEIQILDNGTGISEDDLPRVFKEHFTTKGKGIGLGLFSAKRAVESHDGTIEVHSVEGAYTLFTIRFPVKKRLSIQEEKPSLTMVP
jgi:two-component system, sporulation sensor kinase E